MSIQNQRTPRMSEDKPILDANAFHKALAAQLEQSRKHQTSCAMLLFQIEFEDVYLTRFGVEDLDQLREPFSWLVGRSVRGNDTVGWLYEGCLGVILRSINAEDTSLVATRLQKVLARHPLLIAERNIHLAIQVGGVWYSGLRPMKPADFKLQALQAMGG